MIGWMGEISYIANAVNISSYWIECIVNVNVIVIVNVNVNVIVVSR